MPRPRSNDATRPLRSGQRRRAGHEHLLTDGPALLDVVGCQTMAELAVYLTGAFELDPYVQECTAEHIVIAIRDRGVALPFPFAIEEFWETVQELEGEVTQRLEDAVDLED